MKKILIDKEVYINYYNMGLSDLSISKLMGISNNVLSKFRTKLGLRPNYSQLKPRQYDKINIDSTMHSILIGTLLGDGNLELSVKAKAKNARLRFGHCIEQSQYLTYKVRLLPSLWKMSIRTTHRKCEISSISHPILTTYFDRFYQDGIKIIPKDIGDDITAVSLAILFMDDGSYDKSTNSFYISLCGFTHEDNLLFIKVLYTVFGIEATICNKGKIGHKYMHIYIKACSRELFKNLIEPYMEDSMLYKLGK